MDSQRIKVLISLPDAKRLDPVYNIMVEKDIKKANSIVHVVPDVEVQEELSGVEEAIRQQMSSLVLGNDDFFDNPRYRTLSYYKHELRPI